MAVRFPAPHEGKLKSFFRQCPFTSSIWFSMPTSSLSRGGPLQGHRQRGRKMGERLSIQTSLPRLPYSAGLKPGAQGRWPHTLGLTVLGYRPNPHFFLVWLSPQCCLFSCLWVQLHLPFGPSDPHLKALVLNSISGPAPQHSHHLHAVTRARPIPKLHPPPPFLPSHSPESSLMPEPLMLLTSLPTGKLCRVRSCARIVLL